VPNRKERRKHLQPQHRGTGVKQQPARPAPSIAEQEAKVASLEKLPATYQALSDFFQAAGQFTPAVLRIETYARLERITGRPLLCYVAKTHNVAQGLPSYIDDSDITGFTDLIQSVQGNEADVLLVSNGGSAEATERIVTILRERFESLRYIIPANAFSAATLLCFSGDELIMDSPATLGPIDPQLNGIPVRAILRGFETIEERLKSEGPRALTAYMPLISKYDLHIFEMCKSAQELSKELARKWLSTYMLHCDADDPRVRDIVEFFSNYDVHKSHARAINRERARELGLKVTYVETITGLAELVRSLYNQYEIFFDMAPFFKLFENRWGIGWGRQTQSVTIQLPIPVSPGLPIPVPQPGPPQRSS
jgi:hypothetical protein